MVETKKACGVGCRVTRACVLPSNKLGLKSAGHKVPRKSEVGEFSAQMGWRTVSLIPSAESVFPCSCSLPGCPSKALKSQCLQRDSVF